MRAAHFLDRAGTHFTGRHHELRQLSLWLDGAASDRPVVVAGSPGAGKSALLGVLVCAARPSLAEESPAVRARLDIRSCPSLNHHLAAVHARGRDAFQLVRSIADQLDLPAPWGDGMPDLIDLLDARLAAGPAARGVPAARPRTVRRPRLLPAEREALRGPRRA
jgi:hypothetical protein